ncbi:hypothetical protein CPB85DRAFT_1249955 [Mucidula mucida]|nr:hypothetical protein CPB85DRAFT_1249955 [Mucidula mucida]
MAPIVTRAVPTNRRTILLSIFVAFGFLFGYDIGVISSPAIYHHVSAFGWNIRTATETSIAQMSIGRFIAGLGVGAMSAIVPYSIQWRDCTQSPSRSTPRVIPIANHYGYLPELHLDLATHTISNSASWRIPVGLQMLWGLILLSGIFFLPESHPLVEELVEELMFGIRAENEHGKATWLECFSTRNALWKRTINGMMLQFIQQLNGQNFYYYYGDTFFKSAGTELSPYVIQTILGAVSVVGTVPALYIIEAWGRRRSLLLGAVMEAACSLIAGLVGHFTLAPTGTPTSLLTARNKQGGDTMIAFAVLHVFSFSIFWGPVPWVYLGESFPLRVRPKAIALGSATNWLWNFLLSFFAPRIAEDIGPLILLIFFGMLTFGWFYVYFSFLKLED